MNAIYRHVALALMVALGLMSARLFAQDFSKVEVQTVPLTDNIYALVGAGGTMIASVGEDGVLLIDSGYKEVIEKTVAAVKAITDKPIRHVINTHWHFDHVGGNEALAKAGATIIAHKNVPKRMSADRHVAVIDVDVPASPPEARPEHTYTGKSILPFAGEDVRIMHVPSAHTDGDSLVYFSKSNVLHMGDTWFNGMYTFMDLEAGGSLDGVIKAFDLALTLADEKTVIIPGHGPKANLTDLRAYREMLVTVRDRVRAMKSQGKTREEVIAAAPTREYDATWGKSWLDAKTWVGLIYDTMKLPSGQSREPPTTSDSP